jgi:hypothetical protein
MLRLALVLGGVAALSLLTLAQPAATFFFGHDAALAATTRTLFNWAALTSTLAVPTVVSEAVLLGAGSSYAASHMPPHPHASLAHLPRMLLHTHTPSIDHLHPSHRPPPIPPPSPLVSRSGSYAFLAFATLSNAALIACATRTALLRTASVVAAWRCILAFFALRLTVATTRIFLFSERAGLGRWRDEPSAGARRWG